MNYKTCRCLAVGMRHRPDQCGRIRRIGFRRLLWTCDCWHWWWRWKRSLVADGNFVTTRSLAVTGYHTVALGIGFQVWGHPKTKDIIIGRAA